MHIASANQVIVISYIAGVAICNHNFYSYDMCSHINNDIATCMHIAACMYAIRYEKFNSYSYHACSELKNSLANLYECIPSQMSFYNLHAEVHHSESA